MASNNPSSSGIGILGLMFIVLFVGKIFEIGAVAHWSWWTITSPLWGVPAVLVGFIVVATATKFLFNMTAKFFK